MIRGFSLKSTRLNKPLARTSAPRSLGPKSHPSRPIHLGFGLGRSKPTTTTTKIPHGSNPRVQAEKLVRGEIKEPSEEYHRNSTFYAVSDRELLQRLDADHTIHEHFHPKSFSDKVAFKAVEILRILSDMYFKERYIQRACMLETVAAIPGIVAGRWHHLRCLRKMRNDNWIKSLLDEAENERMHLMTFMEMFGPSIPQRILLFSVQVIFYYLFSAVYILWPTVAHRFTGYLEEEAVKTYSSFLEAIDKGQIENIAAPQIAKDYWGLPEDATLRDVVLVVRADECTHRDVQHTMSTKLQFHGNDYTGPLNIKLSDITKLPPKNPAAAADPSTQPSA